MGEQAFTFAEYFAGGGLAHRGLSPLFSCVFANDIDPMKCSVYRSNFGGDRLIEGDVDAIPADTLPASDLAWASFPCQDLSLAGNRNGLAGARSGVFWSFWKKIEEQLAKGCAPSVLALENVTGLLSSNNGADFVALCETLSSAGYQFGALVIDAISFLPQSRPRLFIVATRGSVNVAMVSDRPSDLFHPTTLRRAASLLPEAVKANWVWWNLPLPPPRNTDLKSCLDRDLPDTIWASNDKLQLLISQMAPHHLKRLRAAEAANDWNVGAVYRRIRTENGKKIQRAEVRYDGVAGCLRTPAGGSSKQLLLVSENGKTRLRTLLAREAARLMGCDETYILPERESAGLKVMGDGVCIPAVKWLSQHLLYPLALGARQKASHAAA